MQEDLPQPVVAEPDPTSAFEAVPPLRSPDETHPAADAAESAEPAVEGAAEAPSVAAAPAVASAPTGLSPAACGAKLIELFPALFAQGAPYGPMKPMKLRIQADLQQRAPGAFSRRTLGIFFSRYTTGNAYLKALTLAPHRFDLDGQPAGEISEEHRRLAAEELARRHALAAERRAAQRPALAPRPDAPPPDAASVATTDGAAPAGQGEPRRAPQGPRRPPHPGRDPRRQPGPAFAPQRGDRPPPPERAGPPQRNERPARAERGERRDRTDRAEAPRPPTSAPASVPLPVDPAQRERVLLLRNYDASPLSKANFCALKGITEADLDAALAQAQSEHGRR